MCVGLFYYTLGNLHPEFRSTLKSIQLIAAVTNKNLNEYGYGKVLELFIKDANKLAEVNLKFNQEELNLLYGCHLRA